MKIKQLEWVKDCYNNYAANIHEFRFSITYCNAIKKYEVYISKCNMNYLAFDKPSKTIKEAKQKVQQYFENEIKQYFKIERLIMKQAIKILDEQISESIYELRESNENWMGSTGSNLRAYALREQIKLLQKVKAKLQIKDLEV